ncbi:MAG: hypothetical protein HON92_07575 [Planctomycetaceae bacterium]|nr:hypothetical protein [Planctomycetaceae bacterium]MBT7256648.1 hypothetical protein [Planctomycetaceae bacterium]
MTTFQRIIAFIIVAATTTSYAADGTYTVIVSQQTNKKAEWKKVVQTLVAKHEAQVIVFDGQVGDSLPKLTQQFPKYVCFVSTPNETTTEFVAAVHQLTRKLDDDPYTDTLWGILTGFDAANALAIAKHREPLTIHKVASGTEIALQCCTEGLWYDELVKNKLVQKKRDATAKQLRGPDDTTAALVDTLNQYQADLFVTSGHATQGDWMIGFRYRNGFFRSKAGQMFGVDTNKTRIDIDSNNPKVYLPIGNCLMGSINGPDAMALAWMNDVGVKQMIGYTVPTWYGYQGWGILDYFIEQPGRYTMNQAFFANHHALVHRLGESSTSAGDKRGLQFDRDVVAFYGDPAWSAKMANGQNSFEQTIDSGRNSMTFTITPNHGEASFDTVNNNGSQRGGRPFVGFFEQRIKNIKITSGHDLHPIVTDNFILVPRPQKCDPTQEYKVTLTFEIID